MKKVEKKVKKVGGGGEWNKLTRPIGVPSPSSRVERGTTELRKEVYEASYEGFFQWCSLDRSYPKLFFTEFVKLANLHDACDNAIVKAQLCRAMHDCWVAWFEKIKHYLLDVAGTKLPERPDGDGYKDMVLRFHRATKGGAK